MLWKFSVLTNSLANHRQTASSGIKTCHVVLSCEEVANNITSSPYGRLVNLHPCPSNTPWFDNLYSLQFAHGMFNPALKNMGPITSPCVTPRWMLNSSLLCTGRVWPFSWCQTNYTSIVECLAPMKHRVEECVFLLKGWQAVPTMPTIFYNAVFFHIFSQIFIFHVPASFLGWKKSIWTCSTATYRPNKLACEERLYSIRPRTFVRSKLANQI